MDSRIGYLEQRVLELVNQLRRRFNIRNLHRLPDGCSAICQSPDCILLRALEPIADIHLGREEITATSHKAAEMIFMAWYGKSALSEWCVENRLNTENDVFPIELPDEMLLYLHSIYPSWGRE